MTTEREWQIGDVVWVNNRVWEKTGRGNWWKSSSADWAINDGMIEGDVTLLATKDGPVITKAEADPVVVNFPSPMESFYKELLDEIEDIIPDEIHDECGSNASSPEKVATLVGVADIYYDKWVRTHAQLQAVIAVDAP